MARRRWLAATAAAALGLALFAAPGSSAGAAGAVGALVLPQRTQTVSCPSWNGLHTLNPYTSVMAGYVKISGFPAVKVAAGGHVSWGANPKHNASWRTWFVGLKWVGGLVWTGLGRGVTVNGVTRAPTDAERAAALARATEIVHSYLVANPHVTTHPTTEQIASMGHRTQVLACLAEAIGRPAWLVNAAHAHAAYIAKHWKGAWNQGLEQDLGALAVGCIIGPKSIATAAAARMSYSLRKSILPDGSNNEQAPGYAAYNYVQWSVVFDQLQRCGLGVSAGFQRVPQLAEFVAQATQPNGLLVQLGDTVSVAPPSWPGTPTEYVDSFGRTGTAPARTVAVYPNGGYVFDRDTWAPMTSASYMTLRFGPPTALHGHFDHTSVTWYARGHQVLMDTGHVGYTNKKLRTALWQPAAHNELVLDGVHPAHTPTALTHNVQTALYDAYTMVDKPNLGVSRSRTVLLSKGQAPLAMVVSDWSSAAKASLVPKISAGVYRQHWHLPPGYGVKVNGVDRITATSGSEKITLIRVPVAGTPSKRSAGAARSFQAYNIGRIHANYDAQFTSVGWSTHMLTVVVPSAVTDAVGVTRSANPDGTSTLTITVGASVLYVTLSSAGNPVSASVPTPPAPPTQAPTADPSPSTSTQAPTGIG